MYADWEIFKFESEAWKLRINSFVCLGLDPKGGHSHPCCDYDYCDFCKHGLVRKTGYVKNNDGLVKKIGKKVDCLFSRQLIFIAKCKHCFKKFVCYSTGCLKHNNLTKINQAITSNFKDP